MPSAAAKRCLALLTTLSLLWPQAVGAAINLPSMGESSGVVSEQKEDELGRTWLRMFRQKVPPYNDPQFQAYIEQLLYDLASHSELQDFHLDVIIVNNPAINAFAVPGGVVGIHTGTLIYSNSEAELASVLAHEIAHLSQRHFARSVERQRANSIPAYAGLIAGLILAATGSGQAGMAAIASSQAAAMQNALRYSRDNEQEADRVGIATLARSNRDPAAMVRMFEHLTAATRFVGDKPPEFLLSHPLTEERVADVRNRIGDYPPRQYPESIEYHLMRARALLRLDHNPNDSIKRFKNELAGHSLSRVGSRYGLALAQSAAGNYADAEETLRPLLSAEPGRLTYQLAAVGNDRLAGRYDAALSRLDNLAKSYPNNYPLRMERAETLLQADRYHDSELVLEGLAKDRPGDPEVWYQLAETSGLAGNITGVHRARAEYYVLIGVFDKAREHLSYARKMLGTDFKQAAIVTQRLREVAEMEAQTRKLGL